MPRGQIGKNNNITISANKVYFENAGFLNPDSNTSITFNADKVVFNGGTSGFKLFTGNNQSVIVNGALEFTGNFSEMPFYTNSGGSYKPEDIGGTQNLKVSDGIHIHDVTASGAITQWHVNIYTPSILIENSSFDLSSQYGAVMMMNYSFIKGEEGESGLGDITIRHNKATPGGNFGMAMATYLEGGLTDINSLTIDDFSMVEGYNAPIIGTTISTEADVRLNELTINNIQGSGTNGESYGMMLANDHRSKYDPTFANIGTAKISNITSTESQAFGIYNQGQTDENHDVKITLKTGNLELADIQGINAAGYIGLEGSYLESNQITIERVTATQGEADGFQTMETDTVVNGAFTIDSIQAVQLALGLSMSGGSMNGQSLSISNVQTTADDGQAILIDAQNSASLTFSGATLTPNTKGSAFNYQGQYGDSATESTNTVRDMAIRSLSGAEVNLNDKNGTYSIVGTILAGRGSDDTSISGGTINIDGKQVNIFGDVYAGNGGSVNISLNAGSTLEGQIDDYHELNTVQKDTVFKNSAFTTGEVNQAGKATLTLNGGQWIARGQSFVDTLAFGTEGGLVDLSKNENSSVSINNLTGSGEFTMRLDNDPTKSDMLYIQHLDANAKYQVNVVLNNTTRSVYELEDVRIATTNGHYQSWGDNFTAVLADQGINDVTFKVTKEAFSTEDEDNATINGSGDGSGTYKPGEDAVNEIYGVEEGSTNWVIASTEGTGSDEPSGPSTSLSDAGNALLATARGTYWTSVEIDRLTNRMGDARYANNGDDGLWIRLRQSRLGTDTGEGDFKSDNTVYQVGYDHAFQRDGGRQLVGVAFDYMDTDLDYKGISGEGNTDRYGITAYTTWLADNGFYVDVVGKWGRLDNDFDIINGSGGRVKANYDNNMWAISAEVGRKLSNPKTGMFIEPNAQLQYTMVTDAQYSTNQGTRVDQDRIDSVIGRMGVRIGRAFGEEQNHNIYAKADMFREFMGEQKIHVKDVTTRVKGDTITVQNKGFWFDVGGGFQSQLGRDAYAYADVEYRFGNDLDKSWIVNAGMRYEF